MSLRAHCSSGLLGMYCRLTSECNWFGSMPTYISRRLDTAGAPLCRPLGFWAVPVTRSREPFPPLAFPRKVCRGMLRTTDVQHLVTWPCVHINCGMVHPPNFTVLEKTSCTHAGSSVGGAPRCSSSTFLAEGHSPTKNASPQRMWTNIHVDIYSRKSKSVGATGSTNRRIY